MARQVGIEMHQGGLASPGKRETHAAKALVLKRGSGVSVGISVFLDGGGRRGLVVDGLLVGSPVGDVVDSAGHIDSAWCRRR